MPMSTQAEAFSKVSRREALSLAAGAACAATAASARAAEPKPADKSKLTVGIATLGFSAMTNAELAPELARNGLKTVQLFLAQKDSNFWRYNSRNDVSSMTAERCKAIADAYRSAGVTVHSIGVYTNLIHPDEAERKANLDYFEAMMAIGAHMGVRTFISEAGHYVDDKKPEPHVPLHFQDAVWPQMVDTARELAKRADKYDAKVLLEPFFRGFLCSAKRVRTFLQEVNSPRIRALLDPANLIEVNDLEEMFAQLGPWIDCFHAKDRKLHTDRGVAAGQGDVDYNKFVALAARTAPHAPLVLEYVGPANYKASLAHLRKAMDA